MLWNTSFHKFFASLTTVSPIFTASPTALPTFFTSSTVSVIVDTHEGSRASMAKGSGAGMGAALTMEARAGAERQKTARRVDA